MMVQGGSKLRESSRNAAHESCGWVAAGRGLEQGEGNEELATALVLRWRARVNQVSQGPGPAQLHSPCSRSQALELLKCYRHMATLPPLCSETTQ